MHNVSESNATLSPLLHSASSPHLIIPPPQPGIGIFREANLLEAQGREARDVAWLNVVKPQSLRMKYLQGEDKTYHHQHFILSNITYLHSQQSYAGVHLHFKLLEAKSHVATLHFFRYHLISIVKVAAAGVTSGQAIIGAEAVVNSIEDSEVNSEVISGMLSRRGAPAGREEVADKSVLEDGLSGLHCAHVHSLHCFIIPVQINGVVKVVVEVPFLLDDILLPRLQILVVKVPVVDGSRWVVEGETLGVEIQLGALAPRVIPEGTGSLVKR